MAVKPFDYTLAWQRDNNENRRRRNGPTCVHCKASVPLRHVNAKWQPAPTSRWSWGKLTCKSCKDKQEENK